MDFHTASFRAIGVTNQITVTDPLALAGALRIARAELAALDLACSRFRDDSEIAALNVARERCVSALLTGVFVLGIATFRRWRPAQLPRFVTASLHRSISLLAVVFLGIHVVTAVADPYAAVGVAAVVVPFVAGRSASGWGSAPSHST
jgi:hypothetical protein